MVGYIICNSSSVLLLPCCFSCPQSIKRYVIITLLSTFNTKSPSFVSIVSSSHMFRSVSTMGDDLVSKHPPKAFFTQAPTFRSGPLAPTTLKQAPSLFTPPQQNQKTTTSKKPGHSQPPPAQHPPPHPTSAPHYAVAEVTPNPYNKAPPSHTYSAPPYNQHPPPHPTAAPPYAVAHPSYPPYGDPVLWCSSCWNSLLLCPCSPSILCPSLWCPLIPSSRCSSSCRRSLFLPSSFWCSSSWSSLSLSSYRCSSNWILCLPSWPLPLSLRPSVCSAPSRSPSYTRSPSLF